MPTKTYGLTSNEVVNAAGMCKMYEQAVRLNDKQHIKLFQETYPKIPQIDPPLSSQAIVPSPVIFMT